MSLPQFEVKGSLFESLGAIAPELFADNDKVIRPEGLAGISAVPGAVEGMLPSRQRTARRGTGGDHSPLMTPVDCVIPPTRNL
jgi:hypothetical protein